MGRVESMRITAEDFVMMVELMGKVSVVNGRELFTYTTGEYTVEVKHFITKTFSIRNKAIYMYKNDTCVLEIYQPNAFTCSDFEFVLNKEFKQGNGITGVVDHYEQEYLAKKALKEKVRKEQMEKDKKLKKFMKK